MVTDDLENPSLEHLDPKLSPDEMKRLALEAIQATDTEKVAGKVVDTLSGALMGGLGGATYGAGIGAAIGGLSDLLASALARAKGIDITAKDALTEAGANAIRGATLFPLATAPLGAVEGAIRGYRKSGKPVSTKPPISQIAKGPLLGAGVAGATGGAGLGILGSNLMSDKEKLAGVLKETLKGSMKGGLKGAAIGAGVGAPLGTRIVLDPTALATAKSEGITKRQLAAIGALVESIRLGTYGSGIGALAGGIKGYRKAKQPKGLSAKLGLGAGGGLGALLAKKSSDKKKTAAIGDDAAAGALLGSLIPLPFTGSLGAAIGAKIGKDAETRKKRQDKMSPEFRAAIGSILGGGVLGAAGTGAGVLAGSALAKKLNLPPEVAARLGGYGVGIPSSAIGSAVGAHKGAEGAYKQKKASVALSGLRYASTASYKDTLEKRAFIGSAYKAVKGFVNPSLSQKAFKGFRGIKDAYFGGAPTKGAVGGGLAGAAFGGLSKLNRLRQGRNYAKMSDTDFAKATQDLVAQSSGTGASAEAAKKALKDARDLRNRFLNLGETQGVVPRLFDEGGKINTAVASKYAKEFGGDILKSMAGYGTAGAALGTGAQLARRAMTKKRMAELGTSALPLAAAGGGGLLLGSALAN